MATLISSFRRGRGRSRSRSERMSRTQSSNSGGSQDHADEVEREEKTSEPTSAWEARRRRKSKTSGSGNGSGSPNDVNNGKGKGKNNRRNQDLPPDEYDPYDSDPGESYREHCERLKGERMRSCLAMPRFLQNNTKVSAETGTEATSPPSPLTSEAADSREGANHGAPAGLPKDLARVRYSLRTSISDGSQAQPPAAHLMDRRELRPNNVHINVSHWSGLGGRTYMEDRYAIEDMGAVQVEVSPVNVRNNKQDDPGVEVTFGQRPNRRIKMPLTWLGVFDGHGGDKASQFCADWMSSYVRNEQAFPFDLGFAMKNAFANIDEDFLATGHPDGSTACAATLVGGRRIVCANAGDSRAIVVRRDGTVVRLSRDHKPGMPDETRRISELGGRVIYWGRWRVEGLLAVSRSIGDASLKPYVCSDPEVCEYDIGKDDWFLVMSSDGVWDVMDNEEAAHVIIASSCVMEDGALKIDTNRFKWAARNLAEHAKSCGSSDNFSVVVVDLKSCGNPQSKSGRYKP